MIRIYCQDIVSSWLVAGSDMCLLAKVIEEGVVVITSGSTDKEAYLEKMHTDPKACIRSSYRLVNA
jgi:hypothetical protein